MGELGQNEFTPFPFIAGSHAQTIIASMFTFPKCPESQTQLVDLSDGERVSLEIVTPPNWKPTDETVAMIHGLCGSHESPYLVRLTDKLYKRNVRSIRINLRGCGTGRGHAKRMYHSTMSHDAWEVVNEIKKNAPDSPLTLMGLSLGGNVVLKMAGERGEEANKILKRVIGVSPPIDMQSSAELLGQHKIYERYFMRYLRSDVMFRHNHFDDLPPIEIPPDMTLSEFDEFYLAPQEGFSSAAEYYTACSSKPHISEITVPCNILFSKDDPIVDHQTLDSITIPESVEVFVTKKGGHLGFLGRPRKKGGFYWMDSLLLEWIFS